MGFDPVLKYPWARRLNANLLAMAGEQLAWQLCHTPDHLTNKSFPGRNTTLTFSICISLLACLLALFEHAGTRMYLTNV